jgi:hypothetical protein
VYSNVLQFTTAPPVAPTLTTNAATNVNSLSATSGGVIVIDGGAAITAKGVCWNTTALPTLLIISQLMGLEVLHTLVHLLYLLQIQLILQEHMQQIVQVRLMATK